MLYTEGVICEPSGKHKPKTYNRYTENKEKGIQKLHEIKSSNHKGGEQKK